MVTSIILDIITAALIVVPMGFGMVRGFAYIIVRFLGWIGALVAGFFGTSYVREYLGNGFVGEWIHTSLMKRFGASATEVTITGGSGVGPAETASDPGFGLPAILGNALQHSIDQTVENAVELMVNAMENLILTVFSFLLIVVGIRLLLILVIRPISKRKGKGPVSLFNKVMGLVIGSIEGLLLAFLFLAALIPVMQMSSPETAESLAEGLKNSYLAGVLYDGNLLVAIFGYMGGII